MSQTCGYQGFQAFRSQPQPAMKPGETLASRAAKFRHAGDGVVASASPLCASAHSTTAQFAASHVSERDYVVPDRRGCSVKFDKGLPVSKPSSGMTMSRQSYNAQWLQPGGEHGGAGARAEPPEWVKASAIPPNPNVQREMRSSYQRDLGGRDESPAQRAYTCKTGMASTTLDLCDGTNKATYHIPGYAGFIPSSIRNKHALDHSDGANDRPKPSNLRLYHRHDLPGYTGHDPTNAKNDLGPRKSGESRLTSSGAMVHGEIL